MIIKLNALNYMFDVEFVEGSDVNWSCILGRRLEVSLSATQLSKFLSYVHVSVFDIHCNKYIIGQLDGCGHTDFEVDRPTTRSPDVQ